MCPRPCGTTTTSGSHTMVSVVSAAFLNKWLLLYYVMLLNREVRRTTGQEQIDLSPISSSALLTSDVC
jgi:hypothetical protein